MPPKRKRNDVEAESTASVGRSTRSTARSSNIAGGSSLRTHLPATKPKAKETIHTTSRETAQNKKIAKSTKTSKAEEPPENSPESDQPESPLKKAKKAIPRKAWNAGSSTEKKLSKPPTITNKSAPPSIKPSPYTRARMEQLFATYADEEDDSFVGTEGLEKLCADANISMEGAQPLLFAWLLESSELGKLTKDEWVKGLDALQIDTLDKLHVALAEHEALLISDAPAPKPPAPTKKPAMELYNKHLKYWQYATDIPGAFLNFYNFLFSLAKAAQERNIDIEIAKAFWAALLSPKYPIINEFIKFIDETGHLKGVNKDLWNMTLDFCRSVRPSLEDYEVDGAWPTCLDEFVAWKEARQSVPAVKVVDDHMEA